MVFLRGLLYKIPDLGMMKFRTDYQDFIFDFNHLSML